MAHASSCRHVIHEFRIMFHIFSIFLVFLAHVALRRLVLLKQLDWILAVIDHRADLRWYPRIFD